MAMQEKGTVAWQKAARELQQAAKKAWRDVQQARWDRVDGLKEEAQTKEKEQWMELEKEESRK